MGLASFYTKQKIECVRLSSKYIEQTLHIFNLKLSVRKKEQSKVGMVS